MTLLNIIVFFILVFQLVSYILIVKKLKDYFNPVLFTSIFIFIPFCLSTFKLSVYQKIDYSPYVYLILLSSSAIILIHAMLIKPIEERRGNSESSKLDLSLRKNTFLVIFLLNIIYVVSYLMENKMITGLYLPLSSMDEVGDIHLENIPILREINTVLRFVLPLLNFYLYKKTSEKKYLFMLILTIFVPLSRGSRSAIINAILMIAAFNFRKIKLKKAILLAVLCIGILIVAISIGNERRGTYTSKSYAYEIGVSQTFEASNPVHDIFSWYYGYYSLSFYNFNSSLINWEENKVYFNGLANLNGLLTYFFDNYPTQYEFNSRIISVNGAAVVPTAYYYYLIDFGIVGILIFEIIFYGLLFHYYRKSINNQYFRLVYCFLLLQVLNFVFYSSFYSVCLYPILIIVYIFKKVSHKRSRENYNERISISYNDGL